MPRVARTTCPRCARALVLHDPEDRASKRAATTPLLALGVGLALAIGGAAAYEALQTSDPPALGGGGGMPRLVPPDSGVLGATAEGGTRKKRDKAERADERRPRGERRRGRTAREIDPDDRRAPRSLAEAPGGGPGGIADFADVPPLLPPVGSDEPDPAPPVAGSAPPPLVPVADLADPSPDEDDDRDRDRDGDGDSDERDGGAYTVVLASEGGERGVSTSEDGGRNVSVTRDEVCGAVEAPAVAALGVSVGVFEARDLDDYEDGDRIAYAGRFEFTGPASARDAQGEADELLTVVRSLALPDLGEGTLRLPSELDDYECDSRTSADEEDPEDVGADSRLGALEPVGDVLDALDPDEDATEAKGQAPEAEREDAESAAEARRDEAADEDDSVPTP